MDWKNLIADIQRTGLTQTEIGKQIGIAQSTISDLANGKLTDPRDSVGSKLRRLHKQRQRAAHDTHAQPTEAEGR